jgi:hypothetical protein
VREGHLLARILAGRSSCGVRGSAVVVMAVV